MKQEVNFSDISTAMIPSPEQQATALLTHPDYPGEIIKLDALVAEVAPLTDAAIKVVGVELHLPGESEARVFTLNAETLEGLQTSRPLSEVLAGAERVKAVRRALGATGVNGNGERPDPSESLRIREWARENGWPNMANKGKIADEAREAYAKAHPVNTPGTPDANAPEEGDADQVAPAGSEGVAVEAGTEPIVEPEGASEVDPEATSDTQSSSKRTRRVTA